MVFFPEEFGVVLRVAQVRPGSAVAWLKQRPAYVDADAERDVPIRHQASRQVDSEHAQLALGNPDPEASAAVEIEAGFRRAISGRDNVGCVDEHADGEDERSGAIERTVP